MADNKMTPRGPVRSSVSPVIDGRQITHLAEVGGYSSRFSKPAAYAKPLARGRFECVEYPAGLSVHVCDLEELDVTTTDAELSPRLSFLLLLRGEVNFRLNERAFQLCSHTGPRCAAMILDASTRWERDLQRGCNLTKVHVTVSPQWLTQHCPQTANRVWSLSLQRTRDLPIWRPSVRAFAAAREILAVDNPQAELQRLHIENQALLLVAEGLSALELWQQDHQRTGSRRASRIAEVCHYLDTHIDQPLSLDDIGRMFGMSTSTLQRYFKEVTGMPVGDYVRRKRLEFARELLVSGGVTVSQAAYAAGYSHPTNFIAAYKRHYGCCPGSERNI
ncbi:MAG: AraC family transcriptional regulator [Cellvibrionaceae bacterium]|nr:AraC family transcriptional regulator [Cellvibrionaceae bacterium]